MAIIVKVIMEVRDWVFIDATIDNAVSIALQDGDESTADQGLVVREAGWAAAGSHPLVDQGWPPEDEDLTVDLPATSWRFIIAQLRRWDEVDARVNPRGNEDQNSRFLALADMLEASIG